MPFYTVYARPRVFALAILAISSISFGLASASAQADAVPTPQEVEYDLGFDCPVSSALDSTASVLWVLMENCGGRRYSLRGFNVGDGSPVNDEASAFTDQLAGLDSDDYVPLFNTPVAFTPDGPLQIVYFDIENYDPHLLRLSLDSGEAETPPADSLNSLLRAYSEYPETTVFNGDHTRAVAVGESSLHVLDLTAEAELLEIETSGDAFASFATFSADGTRLYVATLNNPDDMEDYTSILTIYSLADGAVLNTYPVPSPFLYISPDEQYAVVTINDDEAFVLIDLATGNSSEPVRVSEGESKAAECVNDGRSLADVDIPKSGRLPIRDLEWLPDSSGFLTVHSYGGEALGGGAACYLNNSRLRSYTLP